MTSHFFKRLRRIAVALFVSSTLLTSSFAGAADKDKKEPGNTISKKVLPALKAAGEAFNAKNYDAALPKLVEAEAAAGKTPYDQFRIEEMRAAIFTNQGKNAEALEIYEKHQSTPEFFEPAMSENRVKLLANLAFRLQKYDKVLEYGKQWVTAHPDDTSMLDLMARVSYINKDYKAALETSKTAIGVAEGKGEPPQEIWLQLVASCSSNLNDMPGTLKAYQHLLRYYNKPDHWNKGLLYEFDNEKRNDQAAIYVLRLMQETGVIAAPDHYMEYAQLANDKALPAEAAKILQEGFDKNVLGTGSEKAKQQQLLTAALSKAKADKAQLPELEKEVAASKSNDGKLSAGLGLGYFSHQMYEQAIPALETGLAKGGLKNPDDYRFVLAISYLRAGQKEKAREAFQKLGAANPQLAMVTGFWAARTYN